MSATVVEVKRFTFWCDECFLYGFAPNMEAHSYSAAEDAAAHHNAHRHTPPAPGAGTSEGDAQ